MRRVLGPALLGGLMACDTLDCEQPTGGTLEGNTITYGEFCPTMAPTTYHEVVFQTLVAPAGNEPWSYSWTLPPGSVVVGPEDGEVLRFRLGQEPGEVCVRQYVSCGEVVECEPVVLVDQDVYAGQALGDWAARAWAVGFAIDGVLYFGGGAGYDGAYDDWWRYDAVTDEWTELTRGVALNGVGMALDGVGYVYGDAFQRYDVAADSWTQLTPVLGLDGPQAGWADDGAVHVCLHDGNANQLHRYDVASATWTRLSDCPLGVESATVSPDGRVFAGGEGVSEYLPDEDRWVDLELAAESDFLFHLNGRLYSGNEGALYSWDGDGWTTLDTLAPFAPCPGGGAVPAEEGVFVAALDGIAVLAGGKNGNSDLEPYKAKVVHFLPGDP